MIMELFSAAILAGGLINDRIQQNQPYYGTSRDLFRNNPRVQKQRIGTERLTTDIKNGVSRQERDRRRALGYYDGENVAI